MIGRKSKFQGLALVIGIALLQAASAQSHESVVAEGAKLEKLSEEYKFTEGPAVDADGNVYFTDQPNDRILKWSTDGEIDTWLSPAGRSNGLFFDSNGNLIACADKKSQLWRIGPDKSHEVLLDGFEGKRFNGPNDVWVGKDGSFYFTDPFYRREYWGKDRIEPELPKRVYRLAPDMKTVTVVAEGFKQPNGIVGDAEQGVLFVADIGDKKTYRFNIAADGRLENRELFCEMGSDGMTLDQDRNLYLTGRGVIVFDKNGQEIQNIDVPEGWTANVCFGGKKRDYLFITASDSLYKIRMKTTGL